MIFVKCIIYVNNALWGVLQYALMPYSLNNVLFANKNNNDDAMPILDK